MDDAGGGGALAGARFDAVIVGAGAAGLSLASHLAHAGWGDRVLLIDDGSYPIERRAWAWWSTGEGLLDVAASTVVDRLHVAGDGWQRDLELAPYAYRRITGPELSAAAERLVSTRPGYQRLLGTVRALTPEAGGCRVAVELPAIDNASPADGRTLELSARWVFDSVGPESSPAPPTSAAYLDFHGLLVDCPDDAFDEETATLMDFRVGQEAGAAFMYVLPTSSRTALVERTVFAFRDTYDRELHRGRHEAHVRAYLRDQVGADDYRVVASEIGAIPLERDKVKGPGGPVVPIGARAGMVRASTGYGFERMQRHSAAIVSCLARGQSPSRAARGHRWGGALDGVLLRVIRDEPRAAVEVFAAMLTRNQGSRILAFLDEDASVWSQFRLILTLPKAPFLRALARATLVPRR